MVSSFAQLHIVAQIDSDGIINFLILAIMAILWLFASLIKAAGKRKSSQTQPGGLAGPQRESWQQRLARKAEELQRAMEGHSDEGAERIRQQLEERARRREQAQERPSGKITVRSGKGGESVMVYERTESAADSTREQRAARQREAREAVSAGRKAAMTPTEPRPEITMPDLAPATVDLADETLRPLQPIELGREGLEPQREAVTGYDPASVIDSSDADALRKAILHYEILGKPIGLRDPSEQSTIF